jgi:hypothetical protein
MYAEFGNSMTKQRAALDAMQEICEQTGNIFD